MTEPSSADILAAVQALSAKVDALSDVASQHRAETQHGLDQLRADVATVNANVAQVRADVAGVKADTAFTERYIADLQTAFRRHVADPNGHPSAA